MNKNFNFNNKIIYKIILYFFLSVVIIFLGYFFIPKFFTYPPKLIEESIKKNSDFNIKNISKIDYKLFPTPRLRLIGDNLELKTNILKIKDAEIDIIFNSLNLINYQKLNYDKLLVKGGSINIEINKINRLLNYLKKNKKKINFKKNNIFLFHDKKKIFEIHDSITKINLKNNKPQLMMHGLFLNHKISFLLKNTSKNQNKIILKIPKLDISANILLENKNNLRTFEGLINLSVLNNFFQFNFIKEQSIIIKKGFVRNNLINTSVEGEIFFKPHFFFDLDIKPSIINLEKIFTIIQKKYFLKNTLEIEIIKKINGFLNFKNMFAGNIIFKNSEVLFQNFKIGKDDSMLLNAKISDFGNKGKISFNLTKKIKNKNNSIKELKISGFIIPSSSKVTFKKILLDKKNLKAKKIQKYEEKFENEVVDTSLSNIFNESKINNYFITFFN